MKAKPIQADQLDFQDTAAYYPQTNEVSLLPGFIGHHQDAERIKREAHQVYAMMESEPHDAGISSREDMPTHLVKMYRG
jgi:hypothetical protein